MLREPRLQLTRRLLLAKQLLTDTGLAVIDIAASSGFRSLRRFNAAFLSSYRMSPTRLRRAGRLAPAAAANNAAAAAATAAPSPPLVVHLGYRPPHDHAALLGFIAKRAIPGIESIDGAAVRRTVRAGLFGSEPGWLQARFSSTQA